jgi:hypothetical protein
MSVSLIPRAYLIHPLLAMTPLNKAISLARHSLVSPMGGTSILSGMEMALSLLQEDSKRKASRDQGGARGRLKTVFILSDGIDDNWGDRHKVRLLNNIQGGILIEFSLVACRSLEKRRRCPVCFWIWKRP